MPAALSPALGSRTSLWGTAHPGATSIPPHGTTAAGVPRSAPNHRQGTEGRGTQGPLHASPPPPPPLPACTVRRRRRKAVAAQPQRRAAVGRVPVSLAIVSHLPAARRGTGRAVPDGCLCRPRAPPARTATSIGGNWDPPLPRERLPAPIHPTPAPSPTSQGVVLQRAPGTTWGRCRRTAPAPCAATALCAAGTRRAFAFRAQCVQPPGSPSSWVFMAAAALALPSPWHRAAGRNCLPFSQPLQPRHCVHCTSARYRPSLAPRPPRQFAQGFAMAQGTRNEDGDGDGGGGGMVRIGMGFRSVCQAPGPPLQETTPSDAVTFSVWQWRAPLGLEPHRGILASSCY